MDEINLETENLDEPGLEPNLADSLQSRTEENGDIAALDEEQPVISEDKISSNASVSPGPTEESSVAASQIQAEDLSKFLVCGICSQNPVSVNSAPKLLPCLHSFCEKCLQEKYEQQQGSSTNNSSESSGTLNPRLKCPSCGQEFLVSSNGVSGFLNNQFIIENSGDETSKEGLGHDNRVCTSCEDENAVSSSFCVNCSEWLCEPCIQAHQRVKVTRDHIIKSREEYDDSVELNKESNSVASSGQKPLYCKLHPHEQLRLFCATCDKLTCRDCQLVEHKDHRYQFIDEAAGKHREVLKKLLQYLNVNLGMLNDTISEVEKVGVGLEEKETEIKSEVNRAIEKIIKALRHREGMLVAELQGLVQNKLGLLAKQKKDLTQMKRILEHNHDFAKHAVEVGSDVALLYCRKVLGTRLHNLNSLKYRQRPLAYNDLRFALDVEKMRGYLIKVGTVYSQEDLQRRLEHYGNTKSSASQSFSLSSSSTTTQAGTSDNSTSTVSSVRAALSSSTRLSTDPSSNGNSNAKWTFHNVPPRLNPIEAMSAVNKRISDAGSTIDATKYIALSASGGKAHYVTKTGRVLQQPNHHNVSTNKSALTSVLENRHCNGSTSSTNQPKETNYVVLPLSKSSNSGSFSKMDLAANYLQQIKSLTREGHQRGTLHPKAASSIMSAWAQKARMLKSDKGFASDTRDHGSDRSQHSSYQHQRRTNASSSSPKFNSERTQMLDKGHSAPLFNISHSPSQVPRAKSSSSDPGPSSNNHFNPSELQVKQEQPDSPTNGYPSCMQNVALKSRLSSLGMNGHEDAQSGESGFDEGIGNDDYCAVCKNGGELLCCDTCPRVFHLQCHVPSLTTLPSDSWSCGMCENIQEPLNKLKEQALSGESNQPSSPGLHSLEYKACEKLLLELLCHPDSLPFHHRVSKQVPNYYKIVTKPMDFSTMKSKLSSQNGMSYGNVKEFVDDVNLIFSNCALFNPPDASVAKLGKSLEEFFTNIVGGYLPHLEKEVTEPKRKKRREEFDF